MRRTPGFKTRSSTYSIGLAPTSRAKCRVCRDGVGKGQLRIVTHAFVKPGRAHDFVCHAQCATPSLIRAMVSAYGSVERVPMAQGMDEKMRMGLCAQLESNCVRSLREAHRIS